MIGDKTQQAVFSDRVSAWRKRGWPVFPCSPDTKQPLTKSGFRDASDRLYLIENWTGRWPDAMIGLPTGAPIGAFVVDLDPKGDVTADRLLEDLRKACGGSLPPCPMVRTPRGGYHLYFAMPPGVEIGNRANILGAPKGGAMIDVRGTGGYVIAPPSLRHGPKAVQEGCDGVAYEWMPDSSLDDFDPPQAPVALILLVVSRDREREIDDGGRVATEPGQDSSRTPGQDSFRTPGHDAGERERKYAFAAFDRELESVRNAPKGTRNTALNNAALSLASLVAAGALSENMVRAGLEDAAAANGLAKDDGWKSVRATISSGWKAGFAKPRDLSAVAQNDRPLSGGPRRDIPDPDDSVAPERGDGGGGSKLPDDIDLAKAGECKDMRANDTGNAERLIVWYGEDIRYVIGLGWQIWTGKQWERDDGSLQIRLKAQDISKRIELEPALLNASEAKLKILSQAEEAKRKDEQDRSPRDEEVIREAAEIKKDLGKVKGARWKFAISSGNNSRTEAMIRQAAPMARFDGDRLDENLMLFNVGNGTLEFSRSEDPESDPESPRRVGSVQLRPHRREDYVTRIADVDYDPDAECPKFMKFLERAQPDPERRKFLQVITGYANLLGGNRAQKVIYHYGQGANGKSVFIEATSRPLGNYRATVAPETFAGEANRDSSKASSDIARLHSTWVATVEELPRGVPLKENLIKSLTGGGNLTARFLHRETFEFQPKFTPVLSGNGMPEISGNDHGIWRRLLLMPWDVTIPDEDQIDFEEMLDGFKAEWPGILNWMVEGALAYLSHGIQPYVPGDVAELTGDYRDERDPVRMFASACVDPCPGNTISAKRMLAAWNHWCESNGITPWKQRGLGTRLRTLGYRKKQGSDGCFHYLDVRLTVHGMPPDDPVN